MDVQFELSKSGPEFRTEILLLWVGALATAPRKLFGRLILWDRITRSNKLPSCDRAALSAEPHPCSSII